jgi:hypothetical protein
MSTYTVHEPPPQRDEATSDPDRFAFVRDGFSFWAFLLAPLWMLRHRLWLVFAGYLLVLAALLVGLRLTAAATEVMVVALVLAELLVGFEAATLRRFTLARRRWRNVGVVVGNDRESAERRFFDVWVDRAQTGGRSRAASAAWGAPRRAFPSAMAVPVVRNPQGSSDVIGLFPEPGAPR